MRKLYERMCSAEAWVAAAFLVLMVVLIFLGGIMRMLGHPVNWSSDAATCLFAWACFLCADIAWRNNVLMSIEVVTERLPQKLRKFCIYCNYAIITGFLSYVVIGGIQLSWISRARSFQGIPEVSYSWVTMSMPVGAALLLITAVLKIREELRNGARAKRSDEQLESVRMPS
jgi:TRAP-type C4-dicarboxylate transport system permease small subunit